MRWSTLLVAGAVASTVWAAAPPVARHQEGSGVIMLTELPDLLTDPTIAAELTSGLTNTMLVEVSMRQATKRTVKSVAQVNIRFEPWDELYLVTTIGADGTSHSATLSSLADLRSWWQLLELPVVVSDALQVRTGNELEVELRFVPFSLSEQEDTRRWLADGGESDRRNPIADTPGVGVGGVSSSNRVLDGQTSSGRVLDVLVATSISRRALVSFRWSLRLEVSHASEKDPDTDHGGGDPGPGSSPDARARAGG